MKNYNVTLNENEIIILEEMIKHCFRKRGHFAPNQHTFNALTTLENIGGKLTNSIEVNN